MTTEKTKKRGRPVGYRVEDPASQPLRLRVTEGQLSNYRAAADRAEKTLSGWVRDTLDEAAEDQPK